MNAQIALHHRSLAAWSPGRMLRSLPVIVLLALSSTGLLWWCWPAAGRVAEAPSIQPLVHWQDAKHDWLLVVDPATHELVVYDANDGRPLRRLGAAQRVQAIDSIAGEGNRLITIDRFGSRMRVFSLPDLQPMALATR